MPRGDLILIKTSGGRPAVRKVWDIQADAVLVVHDEYYRRWERHSHIIPPAYPIPRTQVFRHDAALARRLAELFAQARQGDAAAAADLEALWAQANSYASQVPS